jgi:hypothetical protein
MCLPVINSLMLQLIQPKVLKNFCTLSRSSRGWLIGGRSVKVDLHCVMFQNFKWVKQFIFFHTPTAIVDFFAHIFVLCCTRLEPISFA